MLYVRIYIPILYPNIAYAFARALCSATRLRFDLSASISPPRKGNAAPSLAGMYAGINAHIGVGFWRIIVWTITRCRALMRRGIENAERKLQQSLARSPRVERGLRWVPERSEGQECILKGTGVFRRPATDGCIELYACLSRGAIVSPDSSNACHDFLPVTRPVLLL